MKAETIHKRTAEIIKLQKDIKDLHSLIEIASNGTECKIKLYAFNPEKKKEKSNTAPYGLYGITINVDGEDWKNNEEKGGFDTFKVDVPDSFLISLAGEMIREKMKRIEYLNKRYVK